MRSAVSSAVGGESLRKTLRSMTSSRVAALPSWK